MNDLHYFEYYSQLQHQQNMLQDTKRTITYRNAIMSNPSRFENKLVLDVGAGSGILSFFAVQAGATHVYAVEASTMAHQMQTLIQHNPSFQDKITIIHAKIEQSDLQIPMVDTILSEPIGVFLFHERMLESYIYARDHYLKPGGTLFPSAGRIHLSPFTDSKLWKETSANADFWKQDSFLGINLSALHTDACHELFNMPVVGQFDHRSILTNDKNTHDIDFNTITLDALQDMTIPIRWKSSRTGMMHGIAGWFDIVFAPTGGIPISLSTSPDTEQTHWYQTRFLWLDPLPIKAHQVIEGSMRCQANDARSYTITVDVTVGEIQRNGIWQLQDQTFTQ
ncbi:S-adenosyl-L-methionine-dependent methyltransferase [Mucor mucedo]|uniref:S-adenosyl-L-methionine-dependent methyltransferase n=1 Tax=Mucor mucedo TaxID=29922 RepID=UPI00221EF079|nr:S-adenosyl-L-methionine-dependent methyltransferase [Mucor mucedo]KAI7891775.1 S-adenosyl-L-methionine-dependent methyltransferase [Mucor mucedo]